MKKVLLSFAFVASVLLSKAQLATLDFSDPAQMDAWATSAASLDIQSYRGSVNGTCLPQNQGLLISPSANSQGQNTTGFLSPSFSQGVGIRIVTFDFDFFAYASGSGNNYNCQSQSLCNATVNMYVVPGNYTSTNIPTGSDILATASKVFESGTNTSPISATLSTALPANTAFRVLVDVNVGNCASGTRYIVDNVVIDFVEETVTPVSFKAFTASRNKSNVAITWTTASEQNNNGFYIQRNDGSGWKNVAFVFSQAADGNSASDLTYSYTDPNNIKGVSQYRILQVDIDGKSKFSEIRSVKGEGQIAKVIVYPNPSSTGDINVVFDGQTARDVNVNDFSGRLIKKYSSVINNLEIKGLPSGVYSILVTEKLTGVKTVQKVVVR